MSNPTPIWKYTWNTSGYEPVAVTLNTLNNQISDVIKLPHSFFKQEGFQASYLTSEGFYAPLSVGVEDSLSRVDILLFGLESELSRLAGAQIYSRIKLNSPLAINASLQISVVYVADAFDPAEFNQSLNQEANVTHKSLTVSDRIMTSEMVADSAEVDEFIGSFGKINATEINFISGKASFAGAQFSEEGCSIPGSKWSFGTINLRANQYGRLTVEDPNNHIFKPYVTLEEMKDTSYIPVVTANNPTSLADSGFMSVDLDNKRIYVNSMQVNQIVLNVQIRKMQAGDK